MNKINVINFKCHRDAQNNVTIHMSQPAFVDSLLHSEKLDTPAVNPVRTPYRSGMPVDKLPASTLSDQDQSPLTKRMQQLVGSLTWLSISMRPDIATITTMLAKYTACPTEAHLKHVQYVLRYLKGTRDMGISFSSKHNTELESFIKFPVGSTVLPLCDANWGPQDQSRPHPNITEQLELFKSRSLSGFLLWLQGPLHWVSKRQTMTARSSAEAEIYATDECVKCLLHLSFLVDGLDLQNELLPPPTTIYNDNMACIQWSSNMTTKGLRHIQIRENAVRESVSNGFAKIKHIEGKINLSDMFTKEDKDVGHFLEIRNTVMSHSPI